MAATVASVQDLIAVTGPTGLIGSHVGKTLRRAGIAVRAVVHPQSKKTDHLAELRALGCEVASADVGDGGALERAFPGCASAGHLVAAMRVVQVFGSGQYRSMRVDVRDLLEVVRQALTRHDILGEAYDLCGPDALAYEALLDEIARALGVRRWKAHIPMRLARALVREFRYLPNPPITQDECEALLVDNLFQGNRTVQV